MKTFTARARERGYEITDHDGWRDVTTVHDGKLFALEINSTVDPDPDMWETIFDHWDDYLIPGVQR